MNDLAAEMKFEDAEVLRRRLDKLHRARHEYKDTFFAVWNFNYIVVLGSDSVSRCRIAFIRRGKITGFEQYEVEMLKEALDPDLRRFFNTPVDRGSVDAIYDEFCLVANFIIDPLQSVDLLPVHDFEDMPTQVIERLQQRKRKRKQIQVP